MQEVDGTASKPIEIDHTGRDATRAQGGVTLKESVQVDGSVFKYYRHKDVSLSKAMKNLSRLGMPGHKCYELKKKGRTEWMVRGKLHVFQLEGK